MSGERSVYFDFGRDSGGRGLGAVGSGWAVGRAHGNERTAAMTTLTERELEDQLIAKLEDLKYTLRTDLRDRAALEANFRDKFNALNHCRLTDAEFERLLAEITTADVFTAAKTLRGRNSFTRDDGTQLNYTMVNIEDWCKNTFKVVSQLRINTDYTYHRYDVLLLVDGLSVAQIELKALAISPCRAMEQIVGPTTPAGTAAVTRRSAERF